MGQSVSLKTAIRILMGLTAVSWILLAVDFGLEHSINVVVLATALMFTTMLILWKHVTGIPLAGSAMRQVMACRECGSIQPAKGFGFCIRCGRVGAGVPVQG